jgi:hypothetical protein
MVKRAAGIVTLTLVTAGAASAADITWGSARNITGGQDVSVEGTSVFAASFDAKEDRITVNGVAFIGGGKGNGTLLNSDVYGDNLDYKATRYSDRAYTSFSAPFSSFPADYQNLLDGGIFESQKVSKVLTLGNLTVGQQYLVQLWFNDPRVGASGANYVMAVDGQVSLDFNVEDAEGSPGQYVLGTFTADSTHQTFTMTTPVDGWSLQALQVRAISEPETLGLILAFGRDRVHPPQVENRSILGGDLRKFLYG